MKKNKTVSNHKKFNFNYLILPVLAGLTFLVYFGSLKHGFLAYDDTDNVVNNILIQKISTANFFSYFTTPLLYMYTPFVYISYAIDYFIGGLNPLIYHCTNLFLHICNTILVFYFIRLLTKRSDLSVITAAIFALSPMNVDSVAWVSARGTLLFTFFFLISLTGYVVYTSNHKKKYLVFSIATFVFSCFSKSTAVTLPVILLIIDFYITRKISLRNVWQKTPYFIIALIFGFITLLFRNDTNTTHTVINFNYIDRIFMFTYSIDAYLLKLFVPFHLSAISSYPVKINGFLPFEYYLSPFILAVFVIFIIKLIKNHYAALCALSFFIVTLFLNLLPLLEDGFLANRYIYLPSIGFGFFAALLFEEFGKTKAYIKFKNAFLSLGVVVILLFSYLTFQRTKVWENTLSLFNDVIEKNADNVFAYNSRGMAKYEIRDFEGSIADYSKAIELNPSYDVAYYNRAISYCETLQIELALNDYNKAIALNLNFSKAYNGRALLYMNNLNNLPDAISDFSNAIKINPDFAQAYYNRGVAYAKMNDFDNACNDWKKVQSLGFDRADEFIEKYCK